jgi:chromosome partitioning protein
MVGREQRRGAGPVRQAHGSERSMGKLIAIGNLKGGTGKSTIAVNLACALGGNGDKVILVDADGQATVTDWHAGQRLPVRVEAFPLGGERDAQRWVARLITLKAEADYVVVDLPPQVGSGIASALLIADLFVIPVTPSGVDLRATGRALDLLRRARAVRGAAKPACMLVPSRVDRRTMIGRRIHATLERFGLRVGPAVRQRSVHVAAFEAGAWIGAHAPGSSAHSEMRVLKDRILELLDEAARLPESQAAAIRPMPAAATPPGGSTLSGARVAAGPIVAGPVGA